MKGNYETIVHPLKPLYDEDSKILILGSFPSVKTREYGFFYGHPQNRFWKLMERLFDVDLDVSIEERKRFLLVHQILVSKTWCLLIWRRLWIVQILIMFFAMGLLLLSVLRDITKRIWGWMLRSFLRHHLQMLDTGWMIWKKNGRWFWSICNSLKSFTIMYL